MSRLGRPSARHPLVRTRVNVEGAVQGVGFRPFVHRRAHALGLSGWVMNAPSGVIIEAEGGAARVEALLCALREAAPPHAKITAIRTEQIAPVGDAGFTIRASALAGAHTADILPDFATCEACLVELFDSSDRRWRYPFINCTQCGPRFSIIEAMPYDRARTSMRRFPMCAACQQEYDDPSSRRFHAEPNACPDCGPRLSLLNHEGVRIAAEHEALIKAAGLIRAGGIVAIKGVGGFHLFADARNEGSVRRLRARKRRKDKPFAMMFPALADVRGACRLSLEEEALLTGPARPIVLVRRADDRFAEVVAHGNPLLGALLPYAPLHHLLMHELGFAVVATSGNLSEEPIVIDEAEALRRLGRVADLFLTHDRPIVRPVEDSVARIMCGGPLLLRRARGYAPAPIAVAGVAPGALGVGGHLKTTIALSRKDSILLWPHIGDLNTLDAREAHVRALKDVIALSGARAGVVACDLHPDYASRRAADALDTPIVPIQHHVAHIATCLSDNDMRPPALGVAWDGAGYGPDGALWGGEFLLLGKTQWRRVASLRSFRLPGGEAAMREPRRAALGLLYAAYGAEALEMVDLAPVASFSAAERGTLAAVLARGVNAPPCSSAGRLFDAFAALAGLRQRSTYEGQAACELEWEAGEAASGRAYPFALSETSEAPGMALDWAPALKALLADVRAGAPASALSEALHNGLAAAIVAVAQRIGEQRVALSGGCFQNVRLTETAIAGLRAAGFTPLWHRQVPPNDGGLALGQAAWAAWLQGDALCA